MKCEGRKGALDSSCIVVVRRNGPMNHANQRKDYHNGTYFYSYT